MYDFEVARPTTIKAAVEALKEEDALVLAGGQTLIPTMKQRLAMPSTLVSLSGIPDLRGICMSVAGELCVGAATSHADVAKHATGFSGLANMAARIGDPAVRNKGTIGGSLANNDPSACYPAAALATNARILTDRREIAADDFFQGMFDTALEDGELITEVRFEVPQVSHYEKFVQPASRFALVGVMVAKYAQAVRVAVTGASEDGVFRWHEAEAALTTTFSSAAIADLTLREEGLIEDIHASPAYRAHLIKVMTKRAVEAAR